MIQIQIPEKAKYIIETIQNAGFEAYEVGGCVRDSLLGRTPIDLDVTTSALPEETAVLPGHGPATSIGNERRNNPFCGDFV